MLKELECVKKMNNQIAPPILPGAIKTSVGEGSDWASVVLMSFLEPQISGRHPHVRLINSESDVTSVVGGFAGLLPSGAEIVREFKSKTLTAALARMPHSWVYLTGNKTGFKVVISGETIEEVEEVANVISYAIPEPPEPDEKTIPIHIWHQSGSGGGSAQRRRLEAPGWAEISDNYSASVRTQLDQLMAMDRPDSNGRLILWHGLPGTGKTTAIRALMRAWSSWCDSQYVIDPEVAFADPVYLTDIMTRKFGDRRRYSSWLDEDDDLDLSTEEDEDRWKLLIAEDSDEFLRADARQSAGAALGRLLNVSDGILGQGSKTLILLTTNEDMRELHPALIRPGRALAKTEFTKLSTTEANHWLAGTGEVSRAATLAELFELKGSIKRIGDQKEPTRIGFGA